MMPLEAKFRSPQLLAQMASDTPVLLAFSGGMDSSVLLHLLHADAQKQGYPLYLAHVHHGIRGEAADADRDFCLSQAAAYGLNIEVLHADVPLLARESGRSLETEAREVRYAFFAELMQQKRIPILVTAHHADDHLETLLFRLARGTTAKGLCGIAPASAASWGTVVRPLLELTRRELAAYAEEHQIPYVTDGTNFDTAYARNAIRARAVPVLEELFEHPQGRALALSQRLREDEDYLEGVGRSFLQDVTGDSMPVKELSKLHPAIRRRVLTQWYSEQTGETLQEIHLTALEGLIRTGHTGNRITLPNGYRAYLQNGQLLVGTGEEKLPNGSPVPLPFSMGVTLLEGSGICISVKKEHADKKIHNLSTTAYINLPSESAIIDGTLFWRTPREGDTLYAGGMHRQVRRLFNQHKIPPAWRRVMPLLCDSKGILWVPFAGCRDGAPEDGELQVSVTLPRNIFTTSSEKEG